jgi:hypothetical protein
MSTSPATTHDSMISAKIARRSYLRRQQTVAVQSSAAADTPAHIDSRSERPHVQMRAIAPRRAMRRKRAEGFQRTASRPPFFLP